MSTDDQVMNAINNLRNHPIIVMKKDDQSFSFGPVTYDDVLKKVNTLDVAKASQQSDISTKILKQNSDYFAEYFYKKYQPLSLKINFSNRFKIS